MPPDDSLTTLDGRQPLIEDDLKNDDDLKNEEDLKYEEDLKDEDNLNNEDNAKCLNCLCKGSKFLFTLKWLLSLGNIIYLFGQRPYG